MESDIRAILGLIAAKLHSAHNIADTIPEIQFKFEERSEFLQFLDPLREHLNPEQEAIADCVYQHIEDLPISLTIPMTTRLRISAIVLFMKLFDLAGPDNANKAQSREDYKKIYSMFE